MRLGTSDTGIEFVGERAARARRPIRFGALKAQPAGELSQDVKIFFSAGKETAQLTTQQRKKLNSKEIRYRRFRYDTV